MSLATQRARSKRQLAPALLDLAADRAPRRVRVDDKLLAEAVDHRMTGLLRTWCPELAVDHDVQIWLAKRDLLTQAHLTRVRETLSSSVERLNAAGLEVATLKGVTTEDRWYGRPGERPCGDVDLWLAPHQLGRAPEALSVLQPDHPWIPHLDGMVSSGRLQAVTVQAEGAIDIDLHFDPLKLGISTRQAKRLWDRTTFHPLPGGGSVRVLDETSTLLQFLVHLNKDRFQRLIGYADIARVIGSGQVDWEALQGFARDEGIEVSVLRSLETVVEELDLVWPDALLRPRGPRARIWDLLWSPAIHLQGRQGRLRFRMRQNWIGLLARGRGLEAARWWLRDLWPSVVAVDLRYGDVPGPYVWKLLRGRWRSALAQRRQLRRLRSQTKVDGVLRTPVQARTTDQRGSGYGPQRNRRTTSSGGYGLRKGASMAEDPSVEVPVEVLIQRLPDGESVLLDLATEEYFGLDATGTAMWDALVAAGRVDEARAQLLERFDVSEAVLRRDLHALVVELARKGLLRVDPEPTPQRDDRS